MSHLRHRLTAYVDGHLDPTEQQRILAHTRHCFACRQAIDRERWVRAQLQRLPGAEPSADLLVNLQNIGGGPVSGPVLPTGGSASDARGFLPSRRRAGVALVGVGVAAAGMVSLAYVVGSAPASEPVRPPVEQFSTEFAGTGGPPPFSDPAVDVLPVLDRRGSVAQR